MSPADQGAVSPSLGRPVRCSADARELWRRHFGDRPVPALRRRVDNSADLLWREQARRAQLEAVRQRLAGTDDMPWPEVEAVWLEAFRIVRAVLQDGGR